MQSRLSRRTILERKPLQRIRNQLDPLDRQRLALLHRHRLGHFHRIFNLPKKQFVSIDSKIHRRPYATPKHRKGKESRLIYLAPIHRQLGQLVLASLANRNLEVRGLGRALGEFGPDGAAGGVVELRVVVAEVDAACGEWEYVSCLVDLKTMTVRLRIGVSYFGRLGQCSRHDWSLRSGFLGSTRAAARKWKRRRFWSGWCRLVWSGRRLLRRAGGRSPRFELARGPR